MDSDSVGALALDTVLIPGLLSENGAELAAGIADTEHLVLDCCGHSSTLERPDAVGPALGALLSSSEANIASG